MILSILAVVAAMAVLALATATWLDSRSVPAITFVGTPDMRIVVEVRGAIATPGVVYLQPGDRVIDVINASGGLREDADRSLINQSSRVSDGQVITIPAISTSGELNSNSDLININTASIDQLKQLPGIGDVLAQRIVAYREFNGPFQTVDELINVDGISQSLIDSIRDSVTVTGDD